jgi:hypothetical protein
MPLRSTYIHRIFNLQFPEPGAYAFEVFIDGTYHAAAALHLRQSE